MPEPEPLPDPSNDSPSASPFDDVLADKAITELFIRHRQGVLLFLRARGVGAEDAEEFCADAFMALRARWEHLMDLDCPEGYVYKVARNMSAQHFRSMAGRGQLTEISFTDENLIIAIDNSETVTENVMVRTALAKLPRHQRDILVRFYWAGYKVREIAEVDGVTEGTINQKLHRARKHVRLILESTEDTGRSSTREGE